MQNTKPNYKLARKSHFLSILVLALMVNSIVANFQLSSIVYAASKEAKVSRISIASSAFGQGQRIPRQYTADGVDKSPPLSWSAAPEGTKSFALVCEDPDAPGGTWIHWIIYDIPANHTNLPDGMSKQPQLTDGSKQGTNSFHRIGYGGPSPPPGAPHRYFFKLYALDGMSEYEPGVKLEKLRQFLEAHEIAQAQTMGIYGR